MCDGVSYTFGAVIQDEFKECSICLCFVQNGDLEKHAKMHGGDEFSFQIPFNRIHLRPGPGHIEMNIARLLLSLLWVPFIKDLANDLGFRTPNAQQVFKNGIDHHRSCQVLEICLYSLAKELVLPYIRTCVETEDNIPAATHFFSWYKKDVKKYAFMFHIVFSFLVISII